MIRASVVIIIKVIYDIFCRYNEKNGIFYFLLLFHPNRILFRVRRAGFVRVVRNVLIVWYCQSEKLLLLFGNPNCTLVMHFTKFG